MVIPAFKRALRVATLVSVIAWSSYWREAAVIPVRTVLNEAASKSPMWEAERSPKTCPLVVET
jgi:hypothetical protein